MRLQKIIPFLSSFLILLGLLILILIFFPVAKQELSYQLGENKNKDFHLISSQKEATESKKLKDKNTSGWKFEKTIIKPVSFDFSLVIPQIGVNELVFPNIDSSLPDEYLSVLKKGVAHAKNSALPGESGPVFLFAHSTDSFYNISSYNAAFFLLNKLKKSDEVFVFYKDKKYTYRVNEKKIVEADKITEEVQKLGKNSLVLQTCWPPGTTLKRLILIAER